MYVYQFLEILFLVVISWSLILAFTNFIDTCLIILLNLETCSDKLDPKKWLYLTFIYLILFLLFIYFFSHEIHDVFGINIK